MKFYENIKRIREELNLTQKEFGEKLGYNYRTISNWELGLRVPSIFVLKKINKIFNVTYDEIFDFNNEE